MRLFIAVPVSDAVREAVRAVTADLRKSRADYKWVEPENLHLTLNFLGEQPAETLPALRDALKKAAVGRAPFEAALGAVGAFDSLDHPRVLWLGLSQGAGKLQELAHALRKAVKSLAIKDDGREFQAHLSLGRMRSPKKLEDLKAHLVHWSDPSRLGKTRFAVDRIVLIESKLTHTGPAYTVVGEAALHE